MPLLLSLFASALSVGNADAATGTKTIRDNATGGDCASIGIWNDTTKTCTMTADFNGTVGIMDSGVTLDGAGYQLSSTTSPRRATISA
ncbi:MAG: hypothetical protein ACYCXF_05240 [Thermoleophilia bacterium]